jgi:hypothetical protein
VHLPAPLEHFISILPPHDVARSTAAQLYDASGKASHPHIALARREALHAILRSQMCGRKSRIARRVP